MLISQQECKAGSSLTSPSHTKPPAHIPQPCRQVHKHEHASMCLKCACPRRLLIKWRVLSRIYYGESHHMPRPQRPCSKPESKKAYKPTRLAKDKKGAGQEFLPLHWLASATLIMNSVLGKVTSCDQRLMDHSTSCMYVCIMGYCLGKERCVWAVGEASCPLNGSAHAGMEADGAGGVGH